MRKHNYSINVEWTRNEGNGSGRFTEVLLNPKVKITDKDMIEKANELHKEANKMCFIANSCNFKIEYKPNTTTA